MTSTLLGLLSLPLAFCALPVLAACLYLLLLTCMSGRLPVPPPAAKRPRFDFVVPAHDEEAGIASTVQSLLAVDYPRELFRVLVVADNCSDATAARAQEAGATVLTRFDAERRGKGYALEAAFARSRSDGLADAVVVVDADTVISKNLLLAFAARLALGAQAVQADYAVRNPDASWRTRLMSVALSMFHVLRSLARERMKVSAGLRGNGMCFTTQVLREVPHEAFSVVEDVEYGIALGEGGHRVHYAHEAHVYGEMVSGGKQSRSQRLRWEEGRKGLRDRAKALLLAAVLKNDVVLLDLALDVLVPPLATLALAAGLGLAASVALGVVLHSALLALWLFGAACAFLFAYVARGWVLSGTGARGLVDLALAPAYILWKLSLSLRGGGRPKDWVRTAREGVAVDKPAGQALPLPRDRG